MLQYDPRPCKIECGAQCTGGNCQVDWQSIPNLWDIGYPIVEATEDGTFPVTKHKGTGGRVTIAGVKEEQLLYEMGDPKSSVCLITSPTFTSIQIADDGEDRVRVSNIQGGAPTDSYKVSISYEAGYKAVGMLIYSWPDAFAKAKASDETLRKRLNALGLEFDAIETQFVGANWLHGAPGR